MQHNARPVLHSCEVKYSKQYEIYREDTRKFYGWTDPDSMTTLGQRWLKVVSSVGPTLDANVGPTSLCSSGERSANMLGQRWPNVASFFPTTLCQHYANLYGLL